MIKLSRDGQVYEFLTRYSNAPLPRDLCSLVRALVLTAMAVFCVGSLIAVLAWGFLHGLFELLAFPFRGYVVWPIAAAATLSVFTIGGLVAFACWLDDRKMKRKSKEAGVIRQAYRAWKDKFCPVVQWETGHD